MATRDRDTMNIAHAESVRADLMPLAARNLPLWQIADALNRLGRRTPHGSAWQGKAVGRALKALKAADSRAPLRPGHISAPGNAVPQEST